MQAGVVVPPAPAAASVAPVVSARRTVALALGVFAVTVVVYATLAAPIPFYDKGEPREALAARDVASGGALVLPRRQGGEMATKPPLFHWLAALALRAGVRPEELAVRVPSVVLGAAGLGVTAALAASSGGVAAGVAAAAVLGSSFEWLRSATQARVDMTLAFFVVAAIALWGLAPAGPRRRAWVRLGYACVALAVLAKGPVGAALPVLVVALDALARRSTDRLRALVDVRGVLLAGAACTGWYALAWWSGGREFAARQLVHENIQRFVGWGDVPHAHSLLYYGPALAGSFFPWTLALPAAAVAAWRRRDPVDRFCTVWVGAVLGFYSLAAGKRSVYLLPLLPALAVLTARTIAAPGAARQHARAALAVGAAIVAVVGLVVAAGGAGRVVAWLTPVLTASDRARTPAVLATIDGLRWPLGAALAVVAGALGVVAGRADAGRVGALVALALAWSVGLTAFGTYPVARGTTPRADAAAVRALLRPGDRPCYRGDVGYAFRYYVGRAIPRCGRAAAERAGTVVIAASASSADGTRYCATRMADGERRGSGCAAVSLEAVR
jgi:4-amino-4-deoxy-L-arabinose transferase-like glycosyltransferase